MSYIKLKLSIISRTYSSLTRIFSLFPLSLPIFIITHPHSFLNIMQIRNAENYFRLYSLLPFFHALLRIFMYVNFNTFLSLSTFQSLSLDSQPASQSLSFLSLCFFPLYNFNIIKQYIYLFTSTAWIFEKFCWKNELLPAGFEPASRRVNRH